MPIRKSNRLKEYDYSQDGFYFLTVCVKDRQKILGDVKNGKMILNKLGLMIKKQWNWLEEHFSYVQLDEFIIMPNHLHGIIIIDTSNVVGTGRGDLVGTGRGDLVGTGRGDLVGTGRDLSLHKIKSISELIGAFKTTSSKLIHNIGYMDFFWQRSFYDHIIRNEKSLIKIREYILNNPIKWEMDRNNLENLLM